MNATAKTKALSKPGPPKRREGSGSLLALPRVGTCLHDYRLVLELARGGMATVFLAHDSSRAGQHQFAAVKCIRPDLSQDDTFIEMFYDEAQIAAQVHHANVCSVLDFNECDGIYYLVLEYLSGRTLSDVRRKLAEEKPEWELTHECGLIARILSDACEGLHAVHELRNGDGDPLNVVHRDISPSNLFVTYDGIVKLIDFGVACGAEQRHKTRTGVLKGKYAYLAPELLRGDKPDRRADIWGMGVVAWELLTHKRLFDQDSEVETLQAIAGDMDIPAPSSVRKGIPTHLDDIVMRALRRDPKERYESARQFGKMLSRFVFESQSMVATAEVSEAMAELFPEGRAFDRKLLEVAEQLEEQTVASLTAVGGHEVKEPRPPEPPPHPAAPSGKSSSSADVCPIEETALAQPAPSHPVVRPGRGAITGMSPWWGGVSQLRSSFTWATGAVAAMAVLVMMQIGSCEANGTSPIAGSVTEAEAAPPASTEPQVRPLLRARRGIVVIQETDPDTGEVILRLRAESAEEAGQ